MTTDSTLPPLAKGGVGGGSARGTNSDHPPPPTPSRDGGESAVLIAADHAGYALKEAIKAALPQHTWIDLGTDTEDRPSDSPDFGYAVARAIEAGRAERGIVVCGTGVGVSIAANRSPAVRCALATNTTMARLTREHNDANVLALGARIVGRALALDIVEVFLATPFAGGRHTARVAKLGAPCA